VKDEEETAAKEVKEEEDEADEHAFVNVTTEDGEPSQLVEKERITKIQKLLMNEQDCSPVSTSEQLQLGRKRTDDIVVDDHDVDHLHDHHGREHHDHDHHDHHEGGREGGRPAPGPRGRAGAAAGAGGGSAPALRVARRAEHSQGDPEAGCAFFPQRR